MKKTFLILIASIFVFSCSSETTPLDEIANLRCDCLNTHDPEKENFMEVVDCLKEVNSMEKFQNLGEDEIMERVKELCPNSDMKIE